MPDKYTRPLPIGAIVFDCIGHRYEVLTGGPWLYRVQPLTPRGVLYVPIGAPCVLGFSDIDKTRWPND